MFSLHVFVKHLTAHDPPVRAVDIAGTEMSLPTPGSLSAASADVSSFSRLGQAMEGLQLNPCDCTDKE